MKGPNVLVYKVKFGLKVIEVCAKIVQTQHTPGREAESDRKKRKIFNYKKKVAENVRDNKETWKVEG